MKLETEIKRTADENQLKRLRDRQALEDFIEDIKLRVPREELPFAIQSALDSKHEDELNDMLAKLFEQKCKELQEEIMQLMEQKLNMQGLIIKDSKDSLELVIDIEQGATSNSPMDENLRKQSAQVREELKTKMERQQKDLDLEFKKKEQKLDRETSERMLNNENQKIQWLKDAQLKEKKEILEKHLPQDSAVKDFMQEMVDEQLKEAEQFKKEQQIEKVRRLQELDKQQADLLKEMADQQDRHDQVDLQSKRLDLEEQKRQKQQMLRKKRQDSITQSNDFIKKLKKDLEKVNEQLDTSLTREKERQLMMMQDALMKKVTDAEQFEREEQDKVRAEADADRLTKEEEVRKLNEIQAHFDMIRNQGMKHQKTVDKRKYLGGKLEQRTEYYTLLMRKRESQIAAKKQQKKFNNTIGGVRQDSGGQFNLDFDNANGVTTTQVSKEQQMKLLTDVLTKIESLEGKVRVQLSKQKVLMGGNSGANASAAGQKASLQISFDTNSKQSQNTLSKFGKY